MAIHVTKINPEFIDERGFISRVVNNSPIKLNSILYIVRKKGSVSANHYHKSDAHYIFVLSGKVKYSEKDMRKEKSAVNTVILEPFDLVLSSPMIAHATEFLEDSVILAFTSENRDQDNYEKDTVRIKIA